MARYFKIDGVALPAPNSGFNIQLDDISSSDSGRNLSGTMDKQVVSTKWSIELNYSNLSDSMISKLLQQVKANTNINFTFGNPMLGKDDTRLFYTGTPNITHKFTKNDIHYWDVSLKFIEV